MNTGKDHELGDFDATVPSEIAQLDVEVQAMFERVRVRLGMRAGGPEMIGRYELRDWIGRGGMGQVYRAYDVELEREVALKLIAPRPGSDPNVLRERLRREARLLAKLDHDNVVRVFDVGVHEGRVYLVMELITGATLRELQTAGSLSTDERLRLYAEAGRGLLAAHERGVVHRDFKPDNVFVGDSGRAKVGDFGLAHVLGEQRLEPRERSLDAPELTETEGSSLTQSGEVLGTFGYMAPEQLRGEPTGAQTDQFGFCVALWEALAGERPFSGASARALLAAMEQPPEGGKNIDVRLRKALMTGLALAPEQRHPSLAEVVNEIEALLERPARRRRRIVYTIALLTLLGGLTAMVVTFRARADECSLLDEVQALRAEYPADEIAAASSTAIANRIDGWLTKMSSDAEQACARNELAAKQHLGRSLRSLDSLLSSIRSKPGEYLLYESLDRFERDLAAAWTVPMTLESYDQFREGLEPHEQEWNLPKILEWCGNVDTKGWGPADHTERLLRCARAQTLVGPRYEDVVASFKQARRLAEATGDDQRRLEANLGAAKTTIMRLQEYERGDELLDASRDLLAKFLRFHPLDLRWTDYYELASIQARERGQYDEAIRLQRRVLANHVGAGRTDGVVAGLVNLGNIFEDHDEPARAEAVYRVAMSLEPADPEAMAALATVLIEGEVDDAKFGEARELFDRLLAAPNHDLQLLAMLGLLSIELELDPVDVEATTRHRERLTEMLLAPDDYPRTPSHALQAWSYVIIAHALLDDELGPAYEAAREQLAELSAEQLAAVDADLALLQQPSIEP